MDTKKDRRGTKTAFETEHAAMFVDIFTCGIRNPRIIHEHLMDAFNIKDYQIKTIKRGSSN